jgi:peptidoglycan/LPS O-acetylase OafA/YrhL
MVISRNNSVCLDAVRSAAALTVFLHHCAWLGLDGGHLAWFRRDVGHSAVVIFFVLSGYVIAASVRPGMTGLEYATKRAARIYSVAIPALVLTLLIDLSARHWHLASTGPAYELNRPWLYGLISLVFAGDFWTLGVPAFSNNPYWSLDYEVWYYVAFGVAVFARGAWRWAGLCLVLALMGPKLWLLFPIWLGGAALLRLQQARPLPRPAARIVAATAIIAILLVKALHIEDPLNAFGEGLIDFPLRFSQWYLGDSFVGVLAMALVYALGSAEIAFPPAVQRPIVSLAKTSFSLYLVHYPLLMLFAALLPGQGGAAILLALGGSLCFGATFEHRNELLRRTLTMMLSSRSTFQYTKFN